MDMQSFNLGGVMSINNVGTLAHLKSKDNKELIPNGTNFNDFFLMLCK